MNRIHHGGFLCRKAILENAAFRTQIQTSCLRSPVTVSGNFDVSGAKKKKKVFIGNLRSCLRCKLTTKKESKTDFQQVEKKIS